MLDFLTGEKRVDSLLKAMIQLKEPKVRRCWTAGREYVSALLLTLMFNASVLRLEDARGGISAGAADNGMAPPSSVPTGNMAQRERVPRARESEIKTQRKSE